MANANRDAMDVDIFPDNHVHEMAMEFRELSFNTCTSGYGSFCVEEEEMGDAENNNNGENILPVVQGNQLVRGRKVSNRKPILRKTISRSVVSQRVWKKNVVTYTRPISLGSLLREHRSNLPAGESTNESASGSSKACVQIIDNTDSDSVPAAIKSLFKK